MMKKLLIGTTALALVAGTVALPTKADAHAWWLWPAVIAGGTGLVVGGAVAANAGYYGYYPHGTITVRSAANCRIARERGPDGYWHRVQICG